MADYKKNSIKVNMVLNAIKGLMSILFPLISFPYASKILGVDNIGKYNFSNSVIGYFILFAGLGINEYAIREGARKRQHKENFNVFANEMFSINIFAALGAYLLFVFVLLFLPKLHAYTNILFILSFQIIFKAIGVEWIYSIYEDYVYITIRSILFQIVSLILLLGVVKDSNDIEKYALVTTIANVGANILNFLHARKYCRVKVSYRIDWKKHLKPIFVLFAMTLTVSIYVSSDITMLGFLCDDNTVGIYSVSTKIYSIVTTILSSVLIVSIPRLSAILGEDNKLEFDFLASDIYKTLLTVLIPAIVGIIILRKQIILLISDYTYIRATSSLGLLSIALFFCLGAWFWGQCILVPMKKEMIVFKVTILSAIINIILNICLIPLWKENAAAITTIISEGISFLGCWHHGKQYVSLNNIKNTIVKIVIGCIGVIAISFLCERLFVSELLIMILTVAGAIIVYSLIEIVLQNDVFMSIKNGIKKKLNDRLSN